MADYCEDQTTVQVTVGDGVGEVTVFDVQTIGGVYRCDLGCWITTDKSDGDIDRDDYPHIDIDTVIKRAEKYIQSITTEHCTDYLINGERVYIIETANKSEIVIKNSNFINSDTSSYQCEFSDPLASFDTKEEAEEYISVNY